jgi:hypothetical protein
MTFTSAIGFHKIRPLNPKNICRSAIRGTFGTKDGKTDGTGFPMGIELVIEGGIPQGPVGQTLKIASCEVLQTTLLLSHILSL